MNIEDHTRIICSTFGLHQEFLTSCSEAKQGYVTSHECIGVVIAGQLTSETVDCLVERLWSPRNRWPRQRSSAQCPGPLRKTLRLIPNERIA